uniref:Si:dkey-8l13.5 n=1 Tax=Sinocyclocheilus grahami TaxID=75366 RepID=A0A672PPW5_SINGR
MGKGRNVTFVLDSSVGMNGFLGPVKNLIIQTLITKASLRDSFYGICPCSIIVSNIDDAACLGRGNLYTVEFDKFGPKGNTFMDTLNTVQPICQPDMVSLASAHRHSIVPGDTVLAPWEPDMRRYGPGRVISGMELRDPLKSDEGLLGLQVLFWNGMTIHVPKQLAVWIPASHREQIIKDLQHYSSRPCCYRVSHCGTMNCFELPCHQSNHLSLPSIPPCHCPVKRCWPMFMSSPLLNNQRRDELERKFDLQLKELQSSQQTQVPSCSSSSTCDSDENEEDTAAEKHRPSRSELVSRSINTEISCLRKPYTQPETRPAWRYWKRGSAEPQHKKPGKYLDQHKNVIMSIANELLLIFFPRDDICL